MLPPPINEMRQMPGMLLHQLRNREVPWERYLENVWLAETRTLTPGWQPYQLDVRDFPAPDLINVQGLPGPGHGGYEGFVKAGALA